MAAADVARYQRYLQPASKHVLLNPSRKPSTNIYSSLYLPRTDFDQERVRLSTYLMWPSWATKSAAPLDLAKTGFYYTGDSDETRCFSCNLTVKNWKPGDVPEVVHRLKSPRCAFLQTDDNQGTTGSSSVESASAGVRSADTSSAACLENSPDATTTSMSANNRVSATGNTGKDVAASAASEVMMNVSHVGSFARTSSTGPTNSNSVESALDEQSSRLAALKMENEKMRNSMTCRKCHSRQVKTLFLPCAHLITCDSCADTVDYCLQCNARILGTVITYLA